MTCSRQAATQWAAKCTSLSSQQQAVFHGALLREMTSCFMLIGLARIFGLEKAKPPPVFHALALLYIEDQVTNHPALCTVLNTYRTSTPIPNVDPGCWWTHCLSAAYPGPVSIDPQTIFTDFTHSRQNSPPQILTRPALELSALSVEELAHGHSIATLAMGSAEAAVVATAFHADQLVHHVELITSLLQKSGRLSRTSFHSLWPPLTSTDWESLLEYADLQRQRFAIHIRDNEINDDDVFLEQNCADIMMNEINCAIVLRGVHAIMAPEYQESSWLAELLALFPPGDLDSDTIWRNLVAGRYLESAARVYKHCPVGLNDVIKWWDHDEDNESERDGALRSTPQLIVKEWEGASAGSVSSVLPGHATRDDYEELTASLAAYLECLGTHTEELAEAEENLATLWEWWFRLLEQ